ncbi:MAG: methyltransferase domain-containing protein [Pseudomonadota bacterium]|nr:methyltransferase domain-containing protein [Pseudomonadota bacterium]
MNVGPQQKLFPEVAAGGYSRHDGGVHFYGRVNALMRPDSVVVDLGAGRGRGIVDDPVTFRRRLRELKGRCAKLVGLDPDPVVLDNPGVDEAYVIDPQRPLPMDDASVDLIISDYVLEHVDDPTFFSSEIDRILRPGGWLCARTPNRWGYIGLATTLVPNRWHVAVLRRAQPDRKSIDVFPTRYRMNTRSALRRCFPPARYLHAVYGHFGEPRYFGHSAVLWRAIMFAARLTPEGLAPTLMVFIQKRGKPDR